MKRIFLLACFVFLTAIPLHGQTLIVQLADSVRMEFRLAPTDTLRLATGLRSIARLDTADSTYIFEGARYVAIDEVEMQVAVLLLLWLQAWKGSDD